MNEYTSIQVPGSFKEFLFKNKHNRSLLILATLAIIIQFGVFKYLYPYASYIHGDSFSYLNAADQNLTINTYLIGYSKFLRLFSVFAKPDYMLVAFQYLFIQSSVLFLLFTAFYFYKTGKIIKTVLLCFMVFNPLFLHLGNMVSSDGLFLALSCIWFAFLLWIIHRPTNKIIIWQAVILFITFTVRYNAMIYPLITGLAFCLSALPLKKRIVGIGSGLALCGCFVFFTMFQFKQLTGNWQYSPFSGWQFANNAMYAYRYVDSAKRKSVAQKYSALDNMVRAFFDSTRDTNKYPSEKAMASTYYMWSPAMPLFQYRGKLFIKDTTAGELKKWASMGPFYKEYGIYIIKKYPWHFIKYFMWPNASKYYAPPVEFLKTYNSGNGYVTPETKKWFGYKTTNVKTRMKNNEVWVLNFYPILSGIINVFILCLLIFYMSLKGWNYNPSFTKGVVMGGSVWLLNAAFTISASSAALRFQSFPIILTSILVALLIDWMLQLMTSLKEKSLKDTYSNQQQQQFMPDVSI